VEELEGLVESTKASLATVEGERDEKVKALEELQATKEALEASLKAKADELETYKGEKEEGLAALSNIKDEVRLVSL